MLDFILNCLIVILLPFRHPGNWHTIQPTVLGRIWPMLMVVLLAVTACSTSSAKTPASDSEIFFPRQKPIAGGRAVPTGQVSGQLVLVEGCLRLNASDDTSYTVVWPPHFTLRTTKDAIQILDDSNQVVGQVGDEVYMDGGETKTVRGIGLIDNNLQQELSIKCQGPYWLVGYVVLTES